MTHPHAAAQPDAPTTEKVAPLYVDFLCYRLNPAFRRLDAATRRRGVQEFLAAARPWQSPLEIRWHVSTGLRAEVDLVLWAFALDIAQFQRFVAAVAKTGLGQYLELTYAFLAVRKASHYTSHHATAFEAGLPPYKYLFLYPFVKSREWYLLPFAERRRAMRPSASPCPTGTPSATPSPPSPRPGSPSRATRRPRRSAAPRAPPARSPPPRGWR